MADLYGNQTGQVNLDNALKNMNEGKQSNLDPNYKPKKNSSSSSKSSETTPQGQYTVPDTNGYLNGSDLTAPTQLNQTDNTGSITGDLKRSNVRQTGVQVPRGFQTFLATFHTQDGDVHADYALGRNDISYAVQQEYSVHFNNELLSFTTKNDNQSDIPTMTLRLSGMRTWDEVLLANDYVSLTVTAWGDKYSAPQTSTLMTGLISEVHPMLDSATNAKTYMITCQSLAKVMSNVTLTTFTELAVNNGQLLQDTSGTSTVDTADDSQDNDEDNDN